jgi:two-component system, chemotaxis family, response regulator Rcp1
MKCDAALGSIPVVVLTTSQSNQDINQTYKLYANCYITKPVDLDQYINVVKAIGDFWITVVTLPADAA